MAVKASAVWHEFQLCTLPDSQQRRDMHAATVWHWDDVRQKAQLLHAAGWGLRHLVPSYGTTLIVKSSNC